ncbi:polysaccharide biosynthesis protein, partial [Roseateles sp. GG27B]
QFAIAWALASNLAVVGCARYEFALPLEDDESSASLLMALCGRVLLTLTAVSAVAGLALFYSTGLALTWLLPLAVLAGGATQWLTLWASRAQRFQLLAISRVLQYGGGALLQLGFGLLQLGALGLLLGPVLAGLATVLLLARPAPLGGWAGLLR